MNGVRIKSKVCLETSVFSALLRHEEDKWKVAHDTLQDAREGRIEVVVSALVLVECETIVSPPSGNGLETDMIADFFESEFVTRCNVDPFTGELARRLRGELSGTVLLSPNGWLWLATAILTDCDYLMTYDRRLPKTTGHASLGKLQICAPCRPWDVGQLSLADVEGVMNREQLASIATQRSMEI